LASGGNDQTVKLWMSAPVSLRTLQGHTKCVRSVVFSPDVQTPASGSDDETIGILRRVNASKLSEVKDHRA